MVEYSLPDYVKSIGPEISVTPIWNVGEPPEIEAGENQLSDGQVSENEYATSVNGR